MLIPMIVEKLHEPVRVVVDFDHTKVRPVMFVRNQRSYELERVNLVYRRRKGSGYDWCFSVSDQANTYVLAYDPATLAWTLEEVQMEG